MAANYTPQGSHKDVQVLSPTAVIDTMVLTAFTIPSHIYFEVHVPLDSFNKGLGPQYLSAAADGLEKLRASPNVTDVNFTTDLDASGLIGDYAVATVTITPPKGATGPFTAEVQFTMGQLSLGPALWDSFVTAKLEEAVSQLESLAAS